MEKAASGGLDFLIECVRKATEAISSPGTATRIRVKSRRGGEWLFHRTLCNAGAASSGGRYFPGQRQILPQPCGTQEVVQRRPDVHQTDNHKPVAQRMRARGGLQGIADQSDA